MLSAINGPQNGLQKLSGSEHGSTLVAEDRISRIASIRFHRTLPRRSLTLTKIGLAISCARTKKDQSVGERNIVEFAMITLPMNQAFSSRRPLFAPPQHVLMLITPTRQRDLSLEHAINDYKIHHS